MSVWTCFAVYMSDYSKPQQDVTEPTYLRSFFCELTLKIQGGCFGSISRRDRTDGLCKYEYNYISALVSKKLV